MSAKRRILAALIVVALFAGGLGLGLYIARVIGLRSAPRIVNTSLLLKEVQTLSDLVTVRYVVERVVIWEDPPKSILGQMFSGDNRILLLAHGIVKAGVDVGQLTPDDLEVNGARIVVRLPAPRITDAYLDEKQTQVIERTTGFLREFDKDLEQTVRVTAVDDMRRAALRSGILKDAESRAQEQLARLLIKLGGFEQVDFRPRNGGSVPIKVSPGGELSGKQTP